MGRDAAAKELCDLLGICLALSSAAARLSTDILIADAARRAAATPREAIE